jgi:hypothetical protein
VDGDSLIISEVTEGSSGLVVDNNDNTITYTPNPGFFGVDTFTYTISDGEGGTDTATVYVTVSPSMLTAHISIEMSKLSFWKWWRVQTTITVSENDASGLPVGGAIIHGHWSGAHNDTVSGKTDKKGNVSFRTGWIRTWGAVKFTVDEALKNDQDYKLFGETEESITGEASQGN